MTATDQLPSPTCRYCGALIEGHAHVYRISSHGPYKDECFCSLAHVEKQLEQTDPRLEVYSERFSCKPGDSATHWLKLKEKKLRHIPVEASEMKQ